VVEVNKQVLIYFSIGKYKDEVLCDVAPIQVGHILLGRPWQFDRNVTHDGFKNRHSFIKDNKTVTFVPLTPREVYKDQMKIERREWVEKKLWGREFKKRWWKDSEKKKESERKERKKWEKKNKTSFYAKVSDVKSAFYTNQPIFVLLYKETCFNTNELDESLPSVVVSLL
jgi:hypothetical protein